MSVPPSFVMEVSFSTNPFDTPVWVDISDFVVTATTNRGRQYELDKMEPGKLTLQLHDFGSGDFDPSIMNGTYGPNITIGKRIRLQAVYGPPFPNGAMFDGFIATWVPTVDADHEDITVEAYDMLRLLGKGNITSLTNANVVAQTFPSNGGNGTAFYRCDEASGAVANDQSGNGLNGTYAGDIVFAQSGALILEPNAAISLGGSGTLTPNPSAIASAVSVCGWFKTTNSGPQCLMDRRPPGDPLPTVQVVANGGDLTITCLAISATISSAAYDDGQWRFFWVSNTGGGAQCELVTDASTHSVSVTPGAVPRPGDVTVLGDLVGGGQHFAGLLDEVITFSGEITIPAVGFYLAANPLTAGDAGFLISETLNGVGVPLALQGTINAGHATVTPPDTSITSESALQYIQDLEYTEGPNLAPSTATNRAIFYADVNGMATFLVGDRSTSASLSLVFGPDEFSSPPQIPWQPKGQWRMDDLNVYGSVIGSVSNGPVVQQVAVFAAYYVTPFITSTNFSGGDGHLSVIVNGGGAQAVTLTGTYASLTAEAAAIQGQVTGVTVVAVGGAFAWLTATGGAAASILVTADGAAQATGFAASSGTVNGTAGGAKYGALGALTLDTLLYDTQGQVEDRVAWELFWVQVPRVRLPQLVIEAYTITDFLLSFALAQLEPGDFVGVVDGNFRYSVGVAEICRVSHTVDPVNGWTASLVVSPANAVP